MSLRQEFWRSLRGFMSSLYKKERSLNFDRSMTPRRQSRRSKARRRVLQGGSQKLSDDHSSDRSASFFDNRDDQTRVPPKAPKEVSYCEKRSRRKEHSAEITRYRFSAGNAGV